jgi:hypothetical protein
VEVAKLIQSSPNQVIITYNKLHAEPKQGLVWIFQTLFSLAVRSVAGVQ